MLGKTIDLGEYDEITGEARVKVATAEALQTFMAGFTPNPQFLYLHVIAMGAGEYYGCNKNGDYFPEQWLISRHGTFETDAKVFKEHKNKPTDPNYGHVAKAMYNHDMHRVELILAIDKEKAPDVVAKVESGGIPEVSMGTKVTHDCCSICGNKAKRKNEYCSHIRYELKRIRPDGKQAYMINVQPTFFDISIVARRADRIALSLGKVANEMTTIDHVYDVQTKVADIEKQIPAMGVEVMERGFKKYLPHLERMEDDLPAALLDRLAIRYSLPDILHTFLMHAVPLKPREFTRIIIVKHGLPLHHFNELEHIVRTAEPDATLPHSSYIDEAEPLIMPFIPNRSSYGPHIINRLVQILGMDKHANDQMIPAAHAQYAQHSLSTVPIQYPQQEVVRPALREPINPAVVALILGGMYGAYRGAAGISKLVETLKANPLMALGVLGLGYAKMLADSKLGANHNVNVKSASFLKTVALPFVGAHFASAHYRNQYEQGANLNTVQKAIAEHPDFLSILAPITIYFGHRAMKNNGMLKTASDEEKLASVANALGMAGLVGGIWKGKGHSMATSFADQLVDVALLTGVVNYATSKVQKDIIPKPPTFTPKPNHL